MHLKIDNHLLLPITNTYIGDQWNAIKYNVLIFDLSWDLAHSVSDSASATQVWHLLTDIKDYAWGVNGTDLDCLLM